MADINKVKKDLAEIQRLYKNLGETNPYEGMDASKVAASKSEVEKLDKALKGVQSTVNDINKDLDGIVSSFSATVNELQKQNKGLQQSRSAFRNLEKISQSLLSDREGINRLSEKELKSLVKKIQQEKTNLKLSLDSLAIAQSELELEIELNGSTKARKDELKRINNAIASSSAEYKENEGLSSNLLTIAKDRLDKEEKIQKSLGLSGGILKGIDGFMNKIGLGALSTAVGFDDIAKNTEEFAESLEGTDLSDAEKKTATMDFMFGQISDKVKSGLKDPMVQIAIAMKAVSALASAIADGFARSQENTSSIAKNLNISNNQAQKLSQNMSAASFGSGALFLSSKGLTESLVEINSELGTSVQFTAEQLATFTKLKKTAGLTGEEMMGIQKLSLANGDSFDENANALLNQVSALNKASGIFINEKDVLKEISTLSAATTLSFGQNPKLIAEAVQSAKALGFEMEQIEGIVGNLLDFESSIEKELQAELLLNKDLNLEKARQAALNNDLATVAKEIADQAGTAAEFAEMNRIQQEAIAQSVGMSREDLAKTLFVQEQLAGASEGEAERREKILNARIAEVGLAQAQKEISEGGLDNMLNQASAAEKMEASMGKINELFTALGAMLAPVVNAFAYIAGAIMESRIAMAALAGVIGGVTTALAVMAVKAVTVAVANIWGGIMKFLGPIGVPVAIGATVGMLGGIAAAINATKGNDVLSPGKGNGGYGDRMLLGPEGAISLNNKDTVIAGTDLFPTQRGNDVVSTGAGTVKMGNDNKETNMLLRTLVTQNKKKPSLSPVGLYEIQ